jgi:hypothetical protein
MSKFFGGKPPNPIQKGREREEGKGEKEEERGGTIPKIKSYDYSIACRPLIVTSSGTRTQA